MTSIALRKNLPTFFAYIDRRQEMARNRLPKHLRPLKTWPIWFQMLLNVTIMIALITLMLNRDDYVSELGPSITMVVCLLFLIYTGITATQMRSKFQKIKGQRLAKINFWVMVVAFICWPLSVTVFLPNM